MKYLKDNWITITTIIIVAVTGYLYYHYTKKISELDMETKQLEYLEQNVMDN